MSAKDDALLFAAQGLGVIPLYGLNAAGDGCACKLGPSCKGPGKHPLPAFAPHGSRDATTDPALIASWPDDCNIAVAPTNEFVCIDFDDANVANLVLDLIDTDPAGTYCAVKTRRGVHLWVRCDHTPGTVLKDSNGTTLGDIKARGLVAVPPNRYVGGSYFWMGDPMTTVPAPRVQGTAVDYAESLLKRVGIKLSKNQRGASWSAPSHPIPPMPSGTGIPRVNLRALFDPDDYPVEDSELRQMDSGTYPTDDRSDTLYRYACDIWRSADRRGLTLLPLSVAGMVKDLDDRSGYHKFTGRADEDLRLWELANDSRAAVTDEAAKAAKASAKQSASSSPPPPSSGGGAGTPPGGSASPPGGGTPPGPVPPAAPSPYFWDVVTQTFSYTSPTRGRQKTIVCNFEPVLLEIRNVWRDTGLHETHWRVRFGSVELVLGPSEIGDERSFSKAVTLGMADTLQTVQNWHHLFVGMREHTPAASVRRVEAYAMTGWRPGHDEFILPGGTITANGPGVVEYEDPSATRSFLSLGVEQRGEASEALGALLQCAPPAVVAALLSQTLGASLLSVAGDGWPKYVLHLRGITGHFKTTTARLFASIFGADSESYPATGWSSTLTALEQAAHRYRDLPVLLDDYKLIALGRDTVRVINTFIQNYGDGTGRSRSRRDLTERPVLVGRGLIVSTGEDSWGGRQESVSARTIEVSAIDADRDRWSERLAIAQKLPMDGVGWAWLRWCCQRGQTVLHDELHSILDAEMAGSDPTIHKRVVRSLAALRTFSRMIQRFVDDAFPEHSALLSQVFLQGWEHQMSESEYNARHAAEMAPFPDFCAHVRNNLEAGKVALQPRLKGGNFRGTQGAEVVGFVDDDAVYFSLNLTFAWFQRMLHQRGETLPYSWRAVVDGSGTTPEMVRTTGMQGTRMLRVALDVFFEPLPTAQDIEDLIDDIFGGGSSTADQT